jgi:hypothetical protein
MDGLDSFLSVECILDRIQCALVWKRLAAHICLASLVQLDGDPQFPQTVTRVGVKGATAPS